MSDEIPNTHPAFTTTKLCVSCGQLRKLTSFPIVPTEDGKGLHYSNVCDSCTRTGARSQRNATDSALIQKLRAQGRDAHLTDKELIEKHATKDSQTKNDNKADKREAAERQKKEKLEKAIKALNEKEQKASKRNKAGQQKGKINSLAEMFAKALKDPFNTNRDENKLGNKQASSSKTATAASGATGKTAVAGSSAAESGQSVAGRHTAKTESNASSSQASQKTSLFKSGSHDATTKQQTTTTKPIQGTEASASAAQVASSHRHEGGQTRTQAKNDAARVQMKFKIRKQQTFGAKPVSPSVAGMLQRNIGEQAAKETQAKTAQQRLGMKQLKQTNAQQAQSEANASQQLSDSFKANIRSVQPGKFK